MAVTLQDLVVEITGDTSGLTRSLRSAEDSVEGASRGITRLVENIRRIAPFALAGLGAAFAAGAKQAIDAASDLNESVNAVNVTFGESARQILEWSETAAQAAGLSRRAFNEAAVPIGALLQNMGLDSQEAAEQTIILAQRAADLASVFNTDLTTALRAISSGLRGQSEPLLAFGVDMRQAAVDANALEQGLSDQEPILQKIDKLLRDSAQAAGDFANTSGELANQERILRAEVENLAARIGDRLLPVQQRLLQLSNDLITAVGDFFNTLDESGAIDRFGDAIGDLLTNLGNIRTALGEAESQFIGFQGFVEQVTLEIERLNVVLNAAAVLFARFVGLRLAALQAIGGNLAGASAELSMMQARIEEIRASTDQTSEAAVRAGASFEESTTAINAFNTALQPGAQPDLFGSLLDQAGMLEQTLPQATEVTQNLAEALDGGGAGGVGSLSSAASNVATELSELPEALRITNEQLERMIQNVQEFRDARNEAAREAAFQRQQEGAIAGLEDVSVSIPPPEAANRLVAALQPLQSILSTLGVQWTDFRNAANRAFASIGDGIVDIVLGFRNLGQVVAQIIQQIIRDLIRAAIQTLIFRTIAGIFTGGAGAAVGNLGAADIGGLVPIAGLQGEGLSASRLVQSGNATIASGMIQIPVSTVYDGVRQGANIARRSGLSDGSL